MRVIAFAGQARSGKTTCADYIAKRLFIERASWATGVKECFCNYFNVDPQFIEQWKVKDEPPPGMDMPVRKSLQFIGDGFRQIYHNIWVDRLIRLKEGKDICIDDTRYNSELERVHKLGGINILLYRPGHENDDQNDSEKQIRKLADYFSVVRITGIVPQLPSTAPLGADKIHICLRNDGTKEELLQKLDNVVLPYIKSKLYPMKEDNYALH